MVRLAAAKEMMFVKQLHYLLAGLTGWLRSVEANTESLETPYAVLLSLTLDRLLDWNNLSV